MDKILKYSGAFSLLYITPQIPLRLKIYQTLESFFAMLMVSKGIENYIAQGVQT